ncbi:hypothetical protein LDENG_00066380 [Lucifuga dentata]|nr:hypothetical protein LDENG_00066380 [Lucifuga dentata]
MELDCIWLTSGQVLLKKMAAEVKVQTGEVGRIAVGGHLHLSPLNDSSSKSLIENPSSNQSLIITPEPGKPVPSPKPRLTPKPFSVERNPIIKPILAPKPHTKPRPEPTRLAGYKPDLPNTPKPQQPVATAKPKPVSTNPNRPSSTAFKPSNKLNTGQTTKPVAQPFKPAPPLNLGDPTKPAERKKHVASSSAHSRNPTKTPAAEWFGTTKKEVEKAQTTFSTSVTRAKSMGFLNQIEPEEEEKETHKPEAAVPLRSHPRGSRPRPVSAIFLASPAKTGSPTPGSRWAERRPLSADLTAKFESIGLSLHRKSPNTDTKENTPEDMPQLQRKEQDKNPKGTTETAETPKPAVSDEGNKSTEELDEDKSIKKRISLLCDSTSSPGAGSTGQGSDLHSPGQPVPEVEPPLGVKQRIKQLTEDIAPTQSPILKSALKPRPLPLDLTRRFFSERSTEPGIPSLSEVADCSESSKDPQRRVEESAIIPGNQSKLVDMKDSQEQVKKTSMAEGPEEGQMAGSTSKESVPNSDIQTVRASVFENVVERHSVLMLDDEKPDSKAKDVLTTLSHKIEDCEDDGSLVTPTYKQPVAPSSPVRVFHSFETVQALEIRAVSESIPSAQREDKAMTLRSRHSEGNRPAAERIGSAQRDADLALTSEHQPRYLRVGALPKWNTADLDQQAGTEKGMQKESERDRQAALEKEREMQKEAEQEEAATASKRSKMPQADEQPKVRATYFALTGQMQEPVPTVDVGTDFGDVAAPFDDFSVRPGQWGSQAKIVPVRRNPSLDKAFGKTAQCEELTGEKSQMSDRVRAPALDSQTTEKAMEVEKKRELKKEAERQKARIKELERESQRQLEKERQVLLEFARMKEREMQREFERQRQKEFEKEKQELEEKQHALERKKHLEKEKQQELERVRQRELERERQQQLEREKQQELQRERQREIERERLRELEREKQRELEKERQREQQRQRQREQERQRELDKERQLLEIQKERQRAEELERIKEMEKRQKQKDKEKQQVIELEKQRLKEKMEKEEAEKVKQMVLQQEMDRLKELDKERERQRQMEMERLKEIEREKQRELERQRQRDLERDRQKQLDLVRQELENQKLRQQELEKERKRKEDLERVKELEKRQLLEFEKQKQAERERQQIAELEKRTLREKMEREEAEKMRKVAKQQEAERQRLKEKQKKEEERRMLDQSPLRPKVLDLDSVLRDDPFSKAFPQRTDPATRRKQASPRAEEAYKPAILDIDSFLSQTQQSPTRDMLPVSGIQGIEGGNGARLQPHTPEWEIGRKVPIQTSVGLSGPVWAPSPQDPWELRPSEVSVDKPMAVPESPRRHANKVSPEQLLLRQEERLLAPERRWSGIPDEPLQLAPFPGTDTKTGSPPDRVSSSISMEQILLPRDPEPHNNRREVVSHRRSQGSQELNRMRSRSVSRRSTPSNSSLEGNLSRMRSRSAQRERDRQIWEQQKQSVSGEEEGKDSDTLIRDTDSQYGTWETGLRTDDSLTPATPSSDSNLSPSPRKPTPPHTPGEHAASLDPDTPDGLSPSSPEKEPLPFPDAPTTLLDTSVLRSRAQLGKKRTPRSRPSRAARQNAAAPLTEAEGAAEDWRYRDSTEEKVESKNEDSDSEEQARGAGSGPAAAASQHQRIPLFPGMDPSALKAQLKKRSDSDNQTEGSTPSASQLSRSPKSPFLSQAARVLPPTGGKENGEEESPQWLKELKSKKRLSQYDNEN